MVPRICRTCVVTNLWGCQLFAQRCYPRARGRSPKKCVWGKVGEAFSPKRPPHFLEMGESSGGKSLSVNYSNSRHPQLKPLPHPPRSPSPHPIEPPIPTWVLRFSPRTFACKSGTQEKPTKSLADRAGLILGAPWSIQLKFGGFFLWCRQVHTWSEGPDAPPLGFAG